MPEAVTWRGRGVYYFDGDVRCPLATIGARGAFASNRLVLDDDASHASWDPKTRTLLVTNARRYPKSTLTGDLLLLGEGRDAGGKPVPVAFHTRFDKRGDRFDARPHLHPSRATRLVSMHVAPITVMLDDGRTRTIAIDANAIRDAWKYPPLASRLGRALVDVRETTRAEEPRDRCGVDVTISVGLGRFRKRVLRVTLDCARDASTLEEALRRGASLRVEALMNLPAAREHVARALFLLGLDEPELDALAARGLTKGEALAFTARGDEGTLAYAGRSIAIARARDVARDYLELDFVGAILASELDRRLARPHAAPDTMRELAI